MTVFFPTSPYSSLFIHLVCSPLYRSVQVLFSFFCPVFSFNRSASQDKLKKLICKFFFRRVFLSFFDVIHLVWNSSNFYKFIQVWYVFCHFSPNNDDDNVIWKYDRGGGVINKCYCWYSSGSNFVFSLAKRHKNSISSFYLLSVFLSISITKLFNVIQECWCSFPSCHCCRV